MQKLKTSITNQTSLLFKNYLPTVLLVVGMVMLTISTMLMAGFTWALFIAGVFTIIIAFLLDKGA